MAALALAGVSVTVPRFFNPPGKPNETHANIVFGDASDTYDTYGIPCPPLSDFGMHKEILRIFIQDPPTGYKYVYDPTARTANPIAPNGTIRIFKSAGSAAAMVEFSGAVPATTLPVTVYGE